MRPLAKIREDLDELGISSLSELEMALDDYEEKGDDISLVEVIRRIVKDKRRLDNERDKWLDSQR